MNQNQRFSQFHLGSHLCREPMPPLDELKHDMEVLKRNGFDLIKLQEHWALDEPEEGSLDLARYVELIEYAQKLDLSVYFGLTCEQAPRWLYEKYTDCRMVGIDGAPITYAATSTLPADGKPGPCFDHPSAQEAQNRFIHNLVNVLAQYDNIAYWNIWQEIGYWAEAFTGTNVCFCDHTQARFRAWLSDHYGSLAGLNEAWHSRYINWESVAPERIPRGKTCLPQDVDWRYFMEHIQIAEILRSRSSVIRNADPFHRPVFAHKGGPSIGSSVDWTYARCQDFLGTSCYPAWSPTREWDDAHATDGKEFDRVESLGAEIWSGVALVFDYIRSCNPDGNPVWAAEFQGGPVSTGLHWGRTPSAFDIRRWMLTAVGCGVTAISFWVTRAEIMAFETNGFSLLDSVGDETERLSQAGKIGRALASYPDLFGVPNLSRPEVAIGINGWNWAVCDEMEGAAEHLEYSTRGWHRLFWEAGVPVDFIDVDRPEEVDVERYRLLIIPFPLSISESVVERIKRFAHDGGTVVSEAPIGRLDEHAVARRGELSAAATELFGARHNSLQMVREPEGGKRWMPDERGWGEYADSLRLKGVGALAGTSIQAHVYVETLSCTTASPILRWGDRVAGCINSVGSGRAVLLGTIVGHSGTAYRSDLDPSWIASLFAISGVNRFHDGDLLIRRRIGTSREAWSITNPTDRIVEERIPARGFRTAADPLGGEMMYEGDELSISVDPLDVRLVVFDR